MKKKLTETIKNANKRWRQWKDELEKRKQQLDNYSEPPQEKKSVLRDNQEITINISTISVFKGALVVFGVILLSKIAIELVDIVVIFLVSLFLSAAFDPAVNRLERWGLSRVFGIILLFILVLGFLTIVIGTVIPAVVEQLIEIGNQFITFTSNNDSPVRSLLSHLAQSDSQMIQNLYQSLSSLLDQINSEQIFAVISTNIQSIAGNLSDFAEKGFAIVSSTIGAVFNFILVLLITFFLVVDRNNMSDFFHSLFPVQYQGYLTEKMMLVQKKIGEWVHGQILLFFIIGSIAFAFFFIMGIPYALTLAMVFGIAEFIPYVGPAISFIISAPIAFSDSFTSGLALIIFYAVLQFTEGNFIIPMVMKKAVGLPPIVTLLALITGASFPQFINPVLGMILAVPVATIVSIFVRDFTERHDKKKEK